MAHYRSKYFGFKITREPARFIALLCSFIVVAFSIAHSCSRNGIESVSRLDQKIHDLYIGQPLFRKLNGPKSRVVTVDSETIATFGYPLSRTIWAEVINKLAAAGAKTIVLDVLFGAPSNETQVNETNALLEAVENARTVLIPIQESEKWEPEKNEWPSQPFKVEILARNERRSTERYERESSAFESSFSSLMKVARGYAVSSNMLESDGNIRKYELLKTFDGGFLPSISFAAFLAQHEISSIRLIVGDKLSRGSSNTELQIQKDGNKITMPSLNQSFPTFIIPQLAVENVSSGVSMVSVLSMSVNEAAKTFGGRCVFVGATAAALAHNQPVPGFAIRSPIFNHQAVYEALEQGLVFTRQENSVRLELLLVLFAALLGFFSAVKPPPSIKPLALLFSLTLLLLTGLACFWGLGPLQMGGSVLALIVTWMCWFVEGFSSKERERGRLRKAFSCYVNPSVAETVAEKPGELSEDGEIRELVFMFTDLRNFTSKSEGANPYHLVKSLNEYLSLTSSKIIEFGGTVDKFIGDSVMAFWGAPLSVPEAPTKALEASVAVLEVFDKVASRWRDESDVLAGTNIGIGLHMGEAIVGNIGGKLRFNYTVIGDNVNTASRIEGLCKKYSVRLIASETLVGKGVQLRFLDQVRVKGKSLPVRIYSLRTANDASEEEFCDAYSSYSRGEFSQAHLKFARLAELYPEDPPLQVFARRCLAMAFEDFYQEWDGIWSWD